MADPREPLVVGIDVGGTKVLAAEIASDGRVLRTAARATPGRASSVEVLEDALTDALQDVAGSRQVVGVGLAAAGIVDGGGERVAFAPHLPWRDDDVRPRLAERWRTRVVLDNDATCAAVAEQVYGSARGAHDAVVVCVGTGIGGGLVIRGALHRGRNGMAGEFGHAQVVPGGRACPCGLTGCWEQYCSGGALVRAHVAAGGPTSVAGPGITAAASKGDPLALAAFWEVGDWLGVGVANLVAAIDPEVVVVGGGLSAAGDLLLDPARAALRRSLVGADHRLIPPLRRATLGPEAGVVGAAALVRAALG